MRPGRDKVTRARVFRLCAAENSDGDSSRVIKRRLYGTSFSRGSFILEGSNGAHSRSLVRRSYSHGSRTKFFLSPGFSRVTRERRSSFFLLEPGPPRRFTISNYNDYADLLRDELFIPPDSSMSRFLEGSAKKRRTRSEIAKDNLISN